MAPQHKPSTRPPKAQQPRGGPSRSLLRHDESGTVREYPTCHYTPPHSVANPSRPLEIKHGKKNSAYSARPSWRHPAYKGVQH